VAGRHIETKSIVVIAVEMLSPKGFGRIRLRRVGYRVIQQSRIQRPLPFPRAGTGWEVAGLALFGEVLGELGDLEEADTFTLRGLQVALHAGLENWFRMALRDLARTAAARDRCKDAAVLLGASRHNMPFYGFDPAIYGPIEERCRNALGHSEFDELSEQGEAMTHDQLMTLVGAERLEAVTEAG